MRIAPVTTLITLALGLACAGPAAPESAQPASSEEQTAAWVRLGSFSPDATPEPVGEARDCQPRLFLPEAHDLPDGSWFGRVYLDDDDNVTLERSQPPPSLPFAPPAGHEARLIEFPCPNRGPMLLELRRGGERTALFTHIEALSPLAPDGRRVFLRNLVDRDGQWVPRARIIDLVSRDEIDLPVLPCTRGVASWQHGRLLLTPHLDAVGDEGEVCLWREDGTLVGGLVYHHLLPYGGPPPHVLPSEPDTLAVIQPQSCQAYVADLAGGRVRSLQLQPATGDSPFDTCPAYEALRASLPTATYETFGEGIGP